MISNDWQRLMHDMNLLDGEDEEARALRLTNYRLQAGLHYEAAVFLKTARDRFSEVRAFLDGLPRAARREYTQVVGGIDPDSKHFHGKWLKANRNRVFHYSKLNGREAVSRALKAAASHQGTITAGDTFGDARFGFADTVAVQWLPDPEGTSQAMEALASSVTAMAQLAQRAADAYLSSRGIRPGAIGETAVSGRRTAEVANSSGRSSGVPREIVDYQVIPERARQDLNLRPFAPEANALSPELRARGRRDRR
jgi:hypothetical protein